jgi:hypothetical protein
MTQQLPTRVAVTLLKRALRDPADEVRLFAFARLEQQRGELEASIAQLSAALETAQNSEYSEEEDLQRLHLQLAQAHWELAYRGLTEGATLEHTLQAARHHATVACRARGIRQAPAEFLVGRVFLRQRVYHLARLAFERAQDAGYPHTRVLPYLAECAFSERRWSDVRTCLDELSRYGIPAYLAPLVEFWR